VSRLFDSFPSFFEDILDGEGAASDVDDEAAAATHPDDVSFQAFE